VIVDVREEERYWYPPDGGIVWLAGYHLVNAATGAFIPNSAPELVARGIRIASVAGADRWHPETLQSEAARPGAPLTLRRDAENEHDPNAIAVCTPEGQLGFVPRDLAATLAPSLDAGETWSGVVLRERRASPRDPRTGVTALFARAASVELRVG
jgi:hypothetical protein